HWTDERHALHSFPTRRSSDLKIDSEIVTAEGAGIAIKQNVVRHGFQDVFNARLGGSWRFPIGENVLIARGGVGHDTAAAKKGWIDRKSTRLNSSHVKISYAGF